MVWIKHYASKLAQAVSVGLDRRFPVCRTGGVTAQEYSFNLAILLQFSNVYGVSTDYILSGERQKTCDYELMERISRIPATERRRVMAAIEAFYA